MTNKVVASGLPTLYPLVTCSRFPATGYVHTNIHVHTYVNIFLYLYTGPILCSVYSRIAIFIGGTSKF